MSEDTETSNDDSSEQRNDVVVKIGLVGDAQVIAFSKSEYIKLIWQFNR